MGKDKGRQRSKGNLKPSSSGRSAELLGGVTSFVGFGGLSDLGYVPAATQATVEDDLQISAEFRVTLRKMSKRDSVTKIKALQEFENLCSSEDIDSIKTALPYWPRLYSKLSIDCDRRVRESTQSAHSALVSQIGKHLAPYLRSIMPSWLLAMTDPHVPAATAATKSFQDSFSDGKRPGVMIFCSKEILEVIFDNLFAQSPQTISDPKITATEEQESKYLRVLFCSLKGLSLLLEITSELSSKKREILTQILPFFEEEKFWKLAKHESTLVRCSWFDTIKTLFEFDVEILRSRSKKLSTIIFSSLDSPDAIVLPHVWIAYLHLCVGLPECWSHCENPKSIFNRIFSVLRDGGRGFMYELSPQLLPILSVIPVSAMEDQTSFYIDFFRAISTSLRKEKVLMCKKEISAIIVALNECLKYISKEHGSNEELWKSLMKYQVVDLVLGSFLETPQLSETQLYHEISKLLLYWTNALDSEGQTYNRGKVGMFWTQFLPQVEQWITEGNEEKINKLKHFFMVIKDPSSAVAKRSKGVRFKEESGNDNTKDLDINIIKQRESYLLLNSLHISPLIRHCLVTYSANGKDVVYYLFSSLVQSYSTEEVYRELVEHLHGRNTPAEALFLEEYILPFMEEGEKNNAPVDTSIEIFLHVYEQLKDDSQEGILMNLKPSLKVSAFKSLVENMASRSSIDHVACSWLESSQLEARIIKCLEQLCTLTLTKELPDSPANKEHYKCLEELLVFVFSNGHQSCGIFTCRHQREILDVLKMFLLKLQSKETREETGEEMCVEKFLLLLTKLLNHLLNSLIEYEVYDLNEIMKLLYHTLCYPLPHCTSESLNAVKACFLNAFEQDLDRVMRNQPDQLFADESSLLAYVLNETKTLIMKESCSYAKAIQLSELLENILPILFRSSLLEEDCSIFLDHSIMQPTLTMLLPTELEWMQLEENLSPLYVVKTILFGEFILREFPLPASSKHTPIWHHGYTRICLFIVKLLLVLCKTPEANIKDDDEDSVSVGQFTPLIALALRGACHLSFMVQMNTFLNNGSVPVDVKLGSEELTKDMQKLLGVINMGNKLLIVKHLRDRSSFGSRSWCVTLVHALNTWIKVPINAPRFIDTLEENCLGYTETKQVLLHYLPKADILKILAEETTKLSELSDDPYSALPSVCMITSALEVLSEHGGDSDTDARQSIETAIHTVFTVLVKWRDAASNIFLFACDLSGVPWEEVSVMVSIIRLLTVIVKGHSLHLLHSHWDVTLCALSAWVQSLVEGPNSPESCTIVAMFATACSKCAGVVSELLLQLKRNDYLKEEYPPTLIEEWEEFFAPSIFNTLLLKFIQCSSEYEKERCVVLYSLTRSFSLCVSNMERTVLKEINLPPLFTVADEESHFKLPDKIQFFLNHLVPLLLSRHPQCQKASYSIIKEFLPVIMAEWEKNPGNVDEDDDLPQRPLPPTLMRVIQEAGPIVETALQDKEMGCLCEMVCYTDSYTYTVGYLLTWLLTLTSILHAQESNQQLYASFIRESNLLFGLLSNLFKLMPQKPTFDKGHVTKPDSTMFNTPIAVSACGAVSSEFLSWLACQVYLACLSQLPAAIRNWFTNLDRNTQQIVDKFTTTNVSPILISNEITTINESTVKFDNMTVKSRPGAREVIAIYTIDETSMELVLRMAANHPLVTVSLEDHKRVGVSVAQWRNWLFGLNTMLSHRNTPLLNSLEFWKKNVDQKFEGIEECFICYYVLHGTNHQIPKLLCRTCKKKFHSACLYKWFNTSNNSTCPICRSLF